MQIYTVKVYSNRTEWYQNDRLHRIDGPAYEGADGIKIWYQNDLLHRKDGPAIEWANGTKEWWLNNKLHRKDGPAIEYADGTKEWWIEGKRYTEQEFLAKTKPASCNGKIVEIEGKKYKLTEIK